MSVFKVKSRESVIANNLAGDLHITVDATTPGPSGDGGSKGGNLESPDNPARKSRTRWARESIMALVRRRSTVDKQEAAAKDGT